MPISPDLYPEVARLYLEERLSLREVGERMGQTPSAVRWALVKFGIPLRPVAVAKVVSWRRVGPHPRKGGGRPADEVDRIKAGVRRYWADPPPGARERMAALARKNLMKRGPRPPTARGRRQVTLYSKLAVYAIGRLVGEGFVVELGDPPVDVLAGVGGATYAVIFQGYWRLKWRTPESRRAKGEALAATGVRAVDVVDDARHSTAAYREALTDKLVETILNWPDGATFLEVRLGEKNKGG